MSTTPLSSNKGSLLPYLAPFRPSYPDDFEDEDDAKPLSAGLLQDGSKGSESAKSIGSGGGENAFERTPPSQTGEGSDSQSGHAALNTKSLGTDESGRDFPSSGSETPSRSSASHGQRSAQNRDSQRRNSNSRNCPPNVPASTAEGASADLEQDPAILAESLAIIHQIMKDQTSSQIMINQTRTADNADLKMDADNFDEAPLRSATSSTCNLSLASR
jgi:hypothetical protein